MEFESEREYSGEEIKRLIRNEYSKEGEQLLIEILQLSNLFGGDFSSDLRECIKDQLVQFLKKPGQFKSGTIDQFHWWLIKGGRRKLLNTRARDKRIRHLSESPVEERDVLTELANREILVQALDSLPWEDAVLFVLRVAYGEEYETLAQHLGTTPQAVRQRISRIKKRLRKQYN